MTPDEKLNLPAIRARYEQARAAIMHGATWHGFDGPDGVSKDEALEYAADLCAIVPLLLDALEAQS